MTTDYAPHGCYAALWSGTGGFGPRWCWEQPRVRRLFDQARPSGARIHSSGNDLAAHAPKLVEDMRAAHGKDFDPWFAVAGDADHHDPVPAWTRAAKAARASGVRVFEFNCEAAWKLGGTLEDREKFAADCVRAVHDEVPELIYCHTAYREPDEHAKTYPYKGFIGPGTVIKFHCPQMYGRLRTILGGVLGPLKAADVRALESCAKMEKAGLIQPGLPVHGYFATDQKLPDLCRAAVRFPTFGMWVLRPGDLTEDSYTAIRVLSELDRRGYRGADALERFQREHSLAPDGVVGPAFLDALGIPYGFGLPS